MPAIRTELAALALSEWVFCQSKQSLQCVQVLKFYLREYWACGRPSSAFESAGFFVVTLLVSKPSSRQFQAQIRNLLNLLHSWTLSELDAALTHEGTRQSSELRAILVTAGKLPAPHPSRQCVELGLGIMRKLLSQSPISAHRAEIVKALDGSAEEARELLFPLLSFRAASASGFRRFTPKFRSSLENPDRDTVVYDALPPMVTKLDLDRILDFAEFPSGVSPSALTVVLDLDETLVNFKESVGLRLRPGVIEFLKGVAEFARPVIFTAATEDYGNWAIAQLEAAGAPRGMSRLFRQHALPFGPVFLKDLSRLGTPLERTVIVDNVRENFVLQPGHGVEISSWFGLDVRDRALAQLLPVLRELAARPEISVPEFFKTRSDRHALSQPSSLAASGHVVASGRSLPPPSARVRGLHGHVHGLQ